MMPIQQKSVMIAVLLVLVTVPQAHAQQRTARSFEQLRFLVKPGDGISITNDAGEKVDGHLVSLTDTELVLASDGARRSFQAGEALRIRQRRGDSLSNGIWIGVGVGIGLVTLAAAADESGTLSPGLVVAAGAIYAAMGAGVGAGVDALIRSRQTIFDTTVTSGASVAITPMLGPRLLGARVGWRF